MRHSPCRTSSDTGGPDRSFLMTCELCHEREAVIFVVDTAESVKLRLCEPCDRQRRTVSDGQHAQAEAIHSQIWNTAGENIIKLPP